MGLEGASLERSPESKGIEKQEAGEVLGRENSSVRYTCVCVCVTRVCVWGGALTKGAKSWLVDVKPECQGDRVAQPHHGRVWRQQDSFQLLRTSCQRDVVYMGSEAQRSHQTTEQVGIYFLHPVLKYSITQAKY